MVKEDRAGRETGASADADPGFLQRLKSIIGDEEPYSWARRVGIPSGTFGSILKNSVPPKARHLKAITRKSGVSLDWLLTGDGPMYRDPVAAHIAGFAQEQDRFEGPVKESETILNDSPAQDAEADVQREQEGHTMLAEILEKIEDALYEMPDLAPRILRRLETHRAERKAAHRPRRAGGP